LLQKFIETKRKIRSGNIKVKSKIGSRIFCTLIKNLFKKIWRYQKKVY